MINIFCSNENLYKRIDTFIENHIEIQFQMILEQTIFNTFFLHLKRGSEGHLFKFRKKRFFPRFKIFFVSMKAQKILSLFCFLSLFFLFCPNKLILWVDFSRNIV